ncbi:MAG: L,D-transpeptidase family protein [Prevotella sp.]|nr:L,D-transpeptidase family protein [Prevotella sp.]
MVSWILAGCSNGSTQKGDLTLEAFSSLKTPVFEITPSEIQSALKRMGQVGKDSLTPDSRTALYYQENGRMLWFGRQGISDKADTLIQHLSQVGTMGFSDAYFKVKDLEDDLQRFRSLDFDKQHSVNDVIARLEYRLTHAYLTYVSGQRYGFVNPKKAINRVESTPDSLGNVKVRYVNLFDMAIEQPTVAFYQQAIRKIENDSVGEMMKEAEPQSRLYGQLRQRLSSATEEDRKRILINMERCRWREQTPIPTTGKRIIVNVPAFMLYAYGPDSVMSMKIGCGTTKTKTPLLSSAIEFMQINPEWNIPQSIINNDVLHHAGDSSYFARHRYYIAERATGKKVAIQSVSRAMLASGKYRVSQNGGRGNSLGRIVFRFKNNFSVYLHDTSTPAFFQNAWRGVSHGCVRVQRPFDLAHFLLGDIDAWTLDQIRISMDIPPVTEKGRDYVRSHALDEDENGRKLPRKLVSYMPVKPHVPLYIIYYTLYPDQNGQIQTYPDVYGYDQSVWNHLKKFI